MRFTIFKLSVIFGLLAASVLLISCTRQDEVTLENAWIPEAPPSVSALAGYLDISNHFSHAMVLVGAESPYFKQILLHRTVVDNKTDFARMVEQLKIQIPPGQLQKFEPGGYHLMLLGPLKTIEKDKPVPIKLLFADGYQAQVDFKVKPFRLQLETD